MVVQGSVLIRNSKMRFRIVSGQKDKNIALRNQVADFGLLSRVSIPSNVANNRCKWSAAEFASELICLVMYNFYFSLIMTFFTASHSTHENPGEDIYNR